MSLPDNQPTSTSTSKHFPKKSKCWSCVGLRGLKCVIIPNFIASVEPLPCCGDLTIFQNGGRPPFRICYVHVWVTHEQYLVVFIIVHNFVGIDAVVSITCKCWYLTRLAVHTPNWGFCRDCLTTINVKKLQFIHIVNGDRSKTATRNRKHRPAAAKLAACAPNAVNTREQGKEGGRVR